MRGLLAFSRAVDWFSARVAVIANWLVLLAAVVSAGNAASRYLFSESSNGWLEIQWYMFTGMVLLGARLAAAACELESEDANCRNTLGVAEYRAGSYEEALVTLAKSDKRFIA